MRKGLHLTSVPVFEIIQSGSGEGFLPYLKEAVTMNALTNIATLPALPDYLDFAPKREKQTRNGVVVDGKWWTINPHTDEVIGDGKRNHHPQNFAILWDSLRAGLHGSGLQLDSAETKFRSFNNNAGMRVDILLPYENFDLVVGEPTALKVAISNSHDQSAKLSIKAYIERLICSNGQASMSENTSLSQLNTISAEPERIGAVAAKWPEFLQQDAHKMKQMQGVPVSRYDAVMFYSEHVASVNTRSGKVVNRAMLNRIMGIHDTYKALGDTSYRVYNVLTHMSTHVESKACATKKQLVMEDKISGIVNGAAFQELALPYAYA